MATPKNLSVQKAFALLRSFRGPEEWLTNAELSRRSGLSEPCAHRLMKTLEDVGAVVRNRRGCYRPDRRCPRACSSASTWAAASAGDSSPVSSRSSGCAGTS